MGKFHGGEVPGTVKGNKGSKKVGPAKSVTRPKKIKGGSKGASYKKVGPQPKARKGSWSNDKSWAKNRAG